MIITRRVLIEKSVCAFVKFYNNFGEITTSQVVELNGFGDLIAANGTIPRNEKYPHQEFHYSDFYLILSKGKYEGRIVFKENCKIIK